MYDIQVLFSETTEEKKVEACERLLRNNGFSSYDSSYSILTYEEIKYAFKIAQKYVDKKDFCVGAYFPEHEHLFNTLLITSRDMFIAVIKAIVSDKTFINYCFGLLVENFWGCKRFCIGWNEEILLESDSYSNHEIIVAVYCRLLDHYNFSVDYLELPEDCKKQIKQYSQERYDGRLTKPARKT